MRDQRSRQPATAAWRRVRENLFKVGRGAAIAALLVRMAVVLLNFHLAPVSVAAASAADFDVFARQFICTHTGDGGPAPADEQRPSPGACDLCPICATLHASLGAPPLSQAAVAPMRMATRLDTLHEAVNDGVRRYLVSSAQARAPPASI